jgi:hypothetical protein
MQNYKYYKGKGFPAGFPTLLNNWSCPICLNMKSARQYRTKGSKQKEPDAEQQPVAQQVTAAAATTSSAPRDDYFIDFGYAIALGVHKEHYFLLIQTKEHDFLWAHPATHRDSPELLLQEYVDLTGIIPSTIRCDNEFADNGAVKQWTKNHNAVLHPTPAYNHTMGGKIEGAVRISKDHLRCITRAANAPLRFWPYALKHFCRTFGWWCQNNRPPPWTRMPSNCRLYRDQERDLKAWGCLVTGRLPTEHPLV